jgi:hypothetical protein
MPDHVIMLTSGRLELLEAGFAAKLPAGHLDLAF